MGGLPAATIILDRIVGQSNAARLFSEMNASTRFAWKVARSAPTSSVARLRSSAKQTATVRLPFESR